MADRTAGASRDGVLPLSNGTQNGISADEIALYDRQIRLWGLQAQERIRNARILLIKIKALGNEIAKNLVLAGIGSLTIIDGNPILPDDLCSQFLITEHDVGTSRAQAAAPALRKMNPRVNIDTPQIDLAQASNDINFWSQFTMVIATDEPWNSLQLQNTAARFANVPFYAACSHGLYGFVFADLISHTFSITRAKSNKSTLPGTAESDTRSIVSVVEKPDPTDPRNPAKRTELVTKREVYQPLILLNSSPLPKGYLTNTRRLRSVPQLLPVLRALFEFESTLGRPPGPNQNDLATFTRLATEKSRELQLPFDLLTSEFLRSFMQNLYGEIPPTCAFLGGIVAQDVINVLGGREQPIQNMMLFDGDACISPVYAFVPAVTTEDAGVAAAPMNHIASGDATGTGTD